MSVTRVAVRTRSGESKLFHLTECHGTHEQLRAFIKEQVPDATVILIEVK